MQEGLILNYFSRIELNGVSNTLSIEHALTVLYSGRESNLKHRDLGVVFQDLRVQGLGSAATFQATVGSTLNPLLIPEKIRSLLRPPIRDILSGFEGVVNPGEMLCTFLSFCCLRSTRLSFTDFFPQWFSAVLEPGAQPC